MDSTLAEVRDAARALSRAERAEVVHELVATIETTSESDKARYAELRAAVDRGIASLDAGRGTRLSVGDLGDFLRDLGRQATERATATSA